ncbi:MAG: hypothetical protein HYY42_00675 [Chloroflexi bacterium]|nr:hypothetical protein [Chloroflexota bacterium]MBI2982704.1 hypothetical protein [Chloroflexota bacterium]
MRRLGYLLATLLAVTALTAGTASADIEWCAEDPVFHVLGSQFRLRTNVATSASDVTGIAYVVTLPSNAEGSASVQFPRSKRLPTTVELLYTGPAYSGDGTFAVSASVTASAGSGADVRVDLKGPSVTSASFSGTTNEAIRAQFTVSAK